jgi:hypothetical protein
MRSLPSSDDAPRLPVIVPDKHRSLGGAGFDARLDALAKLVRNITLERGHDDPGLVQAFLAAGWTEGNLVDALVVVGDKMVSNFLHGATRIPVMEFPGFSGRGRGRANQSNCGHGTRRREFVKLDHS